MSEQELEALIADTMTRYGLSRENAEISAERRRVYGDPKDNHKGIAMAWAGLLQPHAGAIGRMEAIPEHVVALMMAQLKINRCRLVFHGDNYDDATVYEAFARAWQREQP